MIRNSRLRSLAFATSFALAACNGEQAAQPPATPAIASAGRTATASAPAPVAPKPSGRPTTREELVAATLQAIRTGDTKDVEAVLIQPDDIMKACRVSTEPPELSRRVEKVRKSIAACHEMLGAGPYTVGDIRGGEERDPSPDCPGLVKLRDVKVLVTSGGESFRVTLDDPGYFDKARMLNVDPVICAPGS